jgi:phage terminase large subunit
LSGHAVAEFPDALDFLFAPARYKVAHGGRGSGKSWGFARALLIQAAASPLRVLCAREVQKSIKDSVHKLLSDQIQALGLGAFYEVLETTVRGRNGSEFVFAGLANHTVESIKSYEGIDRCWVEEAQTVRKKSWDILIPTIRKNGSEIWVSLNPDLDTDETYQRFIENPPPGAIVRKVNFGDNPWFSDVLELERQHCYLSNREDYENIWQGKCRVAARGAIYAQEVANAIHEGRMDHVPYDPRLKVHAVWDLGWNDAMSIIMVQRVRSEIRVIDYIEDSHKTLDWYAAELQARRYNWGFDWLPHDGDVKDYKTGKSAAEILRGFGRKVKATPNIPVEAGIKAARMTFAQACFDKTKTARLIECLKRYRRSINQQTNEPGAPVHDEYSHGADAWRYVGVVADKLQNDEDGNPQMGAVWRPLDPDMGY